MGLDKSFIEKELNGIQRKYQSSSYVIILVLGNRKQMSRCQRLGEIRKDCLIGVRFPLEAMKCSGTMRRWWLHSLMKVLNATQ